MAISPVDVKADLSPDEKTVTVRFGSRCPVVAQCLGVDRSPVGHIERIYLDRMVHRSIQEKEFTTWKPYGAITTILQRA